MVARQEESEDSAMVDGVPRAAEAEAALVAVDDAGGDPEAEAGAVELLGGVEGLEDAGADGGGHAMSGVGDGDADAWARAVAGVVSGVVGADAEVAPSLTHGVDGVGDEVVENLADVVLEAEDFGVAVEGGLDGDAGVGQPALVEVKNVIDKIAGADGGGADGLAMEAQRLGGDLADAGEFALRDLDVVGDLLGKVVGLCDEVEEVGDGLERVVDLVRDGAGEAADGGEFLALDEGLLGLLLVRDLLDDGGDGLDLSVGVPDGGVVDVPSAMLAGA